MTQTQTQIQTQISTLAATAQPRPFWRTATGAALLTLSIPAVIAWGLSGVGLLVFALTIPLLIARVRGRRNRRWVRLLGWTTYIFTAVAAALMAVGLLVYNDRITSAHVAIVGSSAIYLSLMSLLPALMRTK